MSFNHPRKQPRLFILFYILTQPSSAQIDVSKFELGIHAGSYIYQGDLTPSKFGSYKSPGLGIGFFVSRHISPSFSLRANLDFGNVKEDESKYSNPSWRQERSLKFKTSTSEISAVVVWDVMSRNYENVRRRLSPYLFAGVGYSFLKINRDYSNLNYETFGSAEVLAALNEDINTNPKGAIVFPVGAGVRYALSPSLSLKLETLYRVTNTDYLDGFSKVGNPDQKDSYFSNTIGVILSLGKRSALNCPRVRR